MTDSTGDQPVLPPVTWRHSPPRVLQPFLALHGKPVLPGDGQHRLLFLLNLFSGALTASVTYTDPASGAQVETGPQTLPGVSVQVMA
jgi:hypothetical protein